MSQNNLKQKVAEAALAYVPSSGIIGVGSGSTVNYFIDQLATIKGRIDGAVAASAETERRLKALSIPIIDLNSVSEIAVYIDGADEANSHHYLIKGGGGALTREKIIAAMSRQFVCIVDETKIVDVLGKFPLPIEVIPMARSYVARQMVKLGGDPVYRQGFVTDNGNVILDIHNLSILDPVYLEQTIDGIAGVVSNGLFTKRKADIVLVATKDHVNTF